ncbi:secreted frizzled-related protein 2-like [Heptranchias perlo]|uniref:secreted frizzled-related protein 2-like n=1 Tax=Heptranchias perlo TaxID=212740 RepID=UPI00355A81F0
MPVYWSSAAPGERPARLKKGRPSSSVSSLTYLLLPVCSVLSLWAGETEAVSFAVGTSESGKGDCKPIPHTMALCYGVGYSQMRLPNLLGHETLREVLQQAGSWVPLLSKRCHPDTRKFLCSLFSPVCLPELQVSIRPCRTLCQEVRDGCRPVMSAFGFPWPEMLDCNRFPVDNDLCIPSATSQVGVLQEESKVCDPCRSEGQDESDVLAHYCKNDLVLKMKVKGVSYLNGDAKIVPEARSRVLYRSEGWVESGETTVELWLVGGSSCSCDELTDLSSSYLVMGQKRGEGRLVATSIRRWRGGKRDLRRITRNFKKARC